MKGIMRYIKKNLKEKETGWFTKKDAKKLTKEVIERFYPKSSQS